jgi:hypothetical protein
MDGFRHRGHCELFLDVPDMLQALNSYQLGTTGLGRIWRQRTVAQSPVLHSWILSNLRFKIWRSLGIKCRTFSDFHLHGSPFLYIIPPPLNTPLARHEDHLEGYPTYPHHPRIPRYRPLSHPTPSTHPNPRRLRNFPYSSLLHSQSQVHCRDLRRETPIDPHRLPTVSGYTSFPQGLAEYAL